MKEAAMTLKKVMVFSAQDWSASKDLAVLWAIIVGWDDESYEQLKNDFSWPDEHVDRLKRLHQEFVSVNSGSAGMSDNGSYVS